MTPIPTNNDNEEKRVCQRIPLKKRVVLEAENGALINGETDNGSLGGILVLTRDNLGALQMGSQLSLYLIIDNKRSRAFPCCVTRISHCAIGLQLDRKVAAAFGLLLTKDMFKRGA
jgi:hypothetical protein